MRPAGSIDKKVAIVGSGPSGLSAAHDLALFGCNVTLYEALKLPGGMLRYGIPEFRLPRDVLDAEIEAVLSLGIELKTDVRIGEDISLETLQDTYDAVLATTGCYKPIFLDIPGEDYVRGLHGIGFYDGYLCWT